jgi:hypothetical protein
MNKCLLKLKPVHKATVCLACKSGICSKHLTHCCSTVVEHYERLANAHTQLVLRYACYVRNSYSDDSYSNDSYNYDSYINGSYISNSYTFDSYM